MNASEDDAAPENSEHAPEDQQAGGGVGEHAQTAGEKAADAVDAGVDIAAGAAQGAKVGGALGAVAGGALAAAKNEKSRRWLLWLIVLVLAPSLLIGGLATAALLSMSLSVTNDIDATGAAGESGVASDRVNLHVDAAANTQVPWYVLTAVDPSSSDSATAAPDSGSSATATCRPHSWRRAPATAPMLTGGGSRSTSTRTPPATSGWWRTRPPSRGVPPPAAQPGMSSSTPPSAVPSKGGRSG